MFNTINYPNAYIHTHEANWLPQRENLPHLSMLSEQSKVILPPILSKAVQNITSEIKLWHVLFHLPVPVVGGRVGKGVPNKTKLSYLFKTLFLKIRQMSLAVHYRITSESDKNLIRQLGGEVGKGGGGGSGESPVNKTNQ